ncbi:MULTISPECIES: DUF4913 domain-containing protein [unclassified Rhodococcus (in: high G+C Gram-positive bacteria)]|uniref:DUF4913 domain-containing protein n=1 Tax=unclassified Rhodococcus (in: high G+C Gram-positive bacteria) TaxID=192944 RepID=UPI00092B0BFF|nr:DUF4913 domain-containing protein [Rhodococcus sp. M8]OLL16039.1 DUF4913 domain-containing protein [Rhodococcus sp. M8]QPG48493.1 DUF4913 domain-containing protein [Rhodococcus sp. M8]
MVNLPRTTDDRWDTGNDAGDGTHDETTPPPAAPAFTPQPRTPAASEPSPEPEQEKKEPKYANVVEFVNGFFLPVIRRRISDNDGGLSWDPRWWAYPEVVARLTALHQAWEEARTSDSMSAMSSWWIQHLEPHLRVILDGDTGPMANAKSDRSFMGWPAMPSDAVPAAVLDAISRQNER